MIKHFDLKLDYRHGENLTIDNIGIGDLQNTVINLLDRNNCLGGEIAPACSSDLFNMLVSSLNKGQWRVN